MSVFGKSLFQPKHRILQKGFEVELPKETIKRLFEIRGEILQQKVSPNMLIEELAEANVRNKAIECNFFESADVLDPKELSPEQKYLMIFDDLLLLKQNKRRAHCVRRRHSNCDYLYWSHNYCKLPRQTSRENSSFFCLFPQNQKTKTVF